MADSTTAGISSVDREKLMEISAENAQDVTWNGPHPSFKVFKPPARNTTNLQPLPDSFFTPTAADLKAAQATLSARTQALVNAPLQLRTTREAEERAKQDRWPNTTIRIKFSDRTQLEKSFPSTDKIRSVYAFVRGSLREDVRTVKFILCTSTYFHILSIVCYLVVSPVTTQTRSQGVRSRC